MKLKYTPRAKLDLAEIHDYIAQENPQAARRVIQLIRKAAENAISKSANRQDGANRRNPRINRWPLPVHACLPHRIGRDTNSGGSSYIQIVAGKFLIL
jgi:plasmid stabilization system protein ParE